VKLDEVVTYQTCGSHQDNELQRRFKRNLSKSHFRFYRHLIDDLVQLAGIIFVKELRRLS